MATLADRVAAATGLTAPDLDSLVPEAALTVLTDLGDSTYETIAERVPVPAEGLPLGSRKLVGVLTPAGRAFQIDPSLKGRRTHGEAGRAVYYVERMPAPTLFVQGGEGTALLLDVPASAADVDALPDPQMQALYALKVSEKVLEEEMAHLRATLPALVDGGIPPVPTPPAPFTYTGVVPQTVTPVLIGTLPAFTAADGTPLADLALDFTDFDEAWDLEDTEMMTAAAARLRTDLDAYQSRLNRAVTTYARAADRVLEQARMDQERLARNAELAQRAGEADALQTYRAAVDTYTATVQHFQSELAAYDAALRKHFGTVEREIARTTSLLRMAAFDLSRLAQRYRSHLGAVLRAYRSRNPIRIVHQDF